MTTTASSQTTEKSKNDASQGFDFDVVRRNMASPAIIFLVIVTQIPLILTLYYSIRRWNLLRPNRIGWIGFDHYIRFITSPEFWQIIGTTLILTFSIVGLSIGVGLAFALLLNRDFPGRGVCRTLLITPFLIMPTVYAVMWKSMLLNPSFGLVNWLIGLVGIDNIAFLSQYPLSSIIVIVAWHWIPFAMLILLSGLQSLPEDLLEAAQIDGANAFDIFRYVIIPHLRRFIEIIILLETVFILSIFGEIFITTSGGPGIRTTNLAYDIYQEAFESFNIGGASALGVYAIVLANVIVILFIQFLRLGEPAEEYAQS